MHLLASLTSPYARKLRVLIEELKLDIAVIETAPLADGAALVAANPLHKVPALVLDDGSSLIDSPVIAAWLLAQAPGHTLLAADGPAHWRARSFEALTDGILDAALALRIEASHGAAARNPEWPTRYRTAIGDTLAALPAARAAIGHDGFGYADICLVVTLDYLGFRFPDIDWRAVPGLAALHAAAAERAALVATRPPEG